MVVSLLRHNRVTKWGAGAGMVVGAAVVAWLTLGGMTTGDLLPFLPQSWHHLNVGMPALVLNVIVLVIVSAATRAAEPVEEDLAKEYAALPA
jgi:SSS family solute:Na+ symporter